MFKLKSFILPCFIAMLCSAGFTACSSDDDGGNPPVNLTDEPMAEHAAKYVVTTSNSDYAAFEFLGDGKYIITKKEARMYAPKKELEIKSIKDIATLLKSPAHKTRATEVDLYIFGDYTVNTEGVYVLDDFGTVKVKDGSKIDIVRNDGFTSTVTVQKSEIKYTGENTNRLCRTWAFDKMDIDYWAYTYHVFTISYLAENQKFEFTYLHPRFEEGFEDENIDVEEMFNGLVDTQNMTKRVTFSPYGTYYIETNSGFTQVSSWKWSNEAAGVIYYNWSDDGYDNQVVGNGYANVNFYGNKLELIEDYSMTDYEDEEESERIKFVTTLVAE